MAATSINSSEILSAAAAAAIDSRNQVQHKRTKWRDFWSAFWCFGPKKHAKRIVPALLAPEANAAANSSQQVFGLNPPATSLAITAPPSSPASIFSYPSAVQSPVGSSSLSAMPTCINSPNGVRSNIFAIGPYAYETQLVSPPVFSTMTTEPSTAPITPPSESVHLTTPPSPEVPFAQLFAHLDINNANKCNSLTFYSPLTSPCGAATKDLQSVYQLYPGSPRITGSGASSPLPESDVCARWSASFSAQDAFISKHDPSKALNIEKILVKRVAPSNDMEFSHAGGSDIPSLDKGNFLNRSPVRYGGEHNSPTQSNIFSLSESRFQKDCTRANTNIGSIGALSSVLEHKFDGSNPLEYPVSKREIRKFQCKDTVAESQTTQLNIPGAAIDTLSSCPFLQDTVSDKELLSDGSKYSVTRRNKLTSSVSDFFHKTSRNSQLYSQETRKSLVSSSKEARATQNPLPGRQISTETASVADNAPSDDFHASITSDKQVSAGYPEFKFDKVDNVDNHSNTKAVWQQHREQRTTGSGVQNWRFFHIMPAVGG
eukprot:TRINITY_DN5401_c0_g1_i1.p1 TRINITY_DN5401_c0_g1~~TRINITY_DN5401_c0_g1_i1.p1  ORF type:complete len:544 (+),score=99.04 TRINITY_DN5401_c0_g1_i1:478-2109(+)